MNLIALEAADVGTDGIVQLTGDRARHLRHVLAVSAGQEIRVGVLDGPLGRGTVVSTDDQRVILKCELGETPARPPIDLLLALPRPKVLRRLWAQLAALGVGRVMLTNAEKVERNYFDTHVLDPQIYRPLLVEGLQQARDTHVPIVTTHRQFRVLIEDDLSALVGDATRLVADPSGESSISEACRLVTGSRALIAIGPEGGWNRFELDLLRQHHFTSVSMGPRTLRVDTACIALLALLNDARTLAT